MVHLSEKPVGFFGAFVVGVTFSLGWTPCIGPVLAAILIIASQGAPLLRRTSPGSLLPRPAIPFFIAALLVSCLDGVHAPLRPHREIPSSVLGGLLIVIGTLLFSGYWRAINGMLA